MTDHTSGWWKVAVLGAILTLTVAVGGWTTRQLLRVDDKLDTRRFELDSVARLTDHTLLIRINTRDSLMYCGSLPLDKQRGCQ